LARVTNVTVLSAPILMASLIHVPQSETRAVGHGQGTEVGHPVLAVLRRAAEEPAVDADLRLAALDERPRRFQVRLARPVAIGPGGHDPHARLVQVDHHDVHVDLARLGDVPVDVAHAGERRALGVGGVERRTAEQ